MYNHKPAIKRNFSSHFIISETINGSMTWTRSLSWTRIWSSAGKARSTWTSISFCSTNGFTNTASVLNGFRSIELSITEQSRMEPLGKSLIFLKCIVICSGLVFCFVYCLLFFFERHLDRIFSSTSEGRGFVGGRGRVNPNNVMTLGIWPDYAFLSTSAMSFSGGYLKSRRREITNHPCSEFIFWIVSLFTRKRADLSHTLRFSPLTGIW